MTTPFHAGEEMVQRRAGTYEMARRVGRGIHRELWPAAEAFVAELRFAVVAGSDAEGRLWASAVAGPRGFLSAEGETLFIGAQPGGGDPLASAWVPGSALGLLAIDPATRRRVRVNGRVIASTDTGLAVEMDEAFGNCPKYIQARVPLPDAAWPDQAPTVATGTSLSAEQRTFVERADTFFIATRHPERGADVSHRGGSPGFVRVGDDERIAFPDYAGNGMFNTLGNLAVSASAALLFVDFDTGTALHLSGRAEVDWSPDAAAEISGAERVVRFTVERAVERTDALPLRWALRERSPFNP
jgi:predicted pyridoxine 5'-phosphate oxidase superfamily flavin-nucleotide-binding protein